MTFPALSPHVDDASLAGPWSRVQGNELLVRRCVYQHPDAGTIAIHATPTIAPGSTWGDLRRAARRDAGAGEVVMVLDGGSPRYAVRLMQRRTERRLGRTGWYFAQRFATSAFGVEHVFTSDATSRRRIASIRQLSRLISAWQFGRRGDGEIAGWSYGDHRSGNTRGWMRALPWLHIGTVMASARSGTNHP